MKKTNLEYLIISVLEKELDEDNQFLKAGEIAYRVGGLLFEAGQKRKSPVTSEMIARRMSNVRQLGLANGIIITPQRKKHKKNGGKSLEVIGWKIADENDRQYVKDDMEIRQWMRNGFGKSLAEIQEIGKRTGLIAPRDLLELDE